MNGRKRGLGRGLDALLGKPGEAVDAVDVEESAAPHEASTEASDGELARVPVDEIYRGRYQPRQDIAEDALEELAQSIRSQGVMQPIVLRRRPTGGYEIIAGERRWRAAQLAGLERIPALLRDVSDEQAIAMALIENIQREDLNPIEEAVALARLAEEFQLTQQEVADAVGKSRTAVTNLLRLLNLNPAVRRMLEIGELEMGHARALLSLDEQQQEATAHAVARRGLSVRQTEALVRKLLAGESADSPPGQADPDTRRLEGELTDKVGAPVSISYNRQGKGQLVIRYSSMDELDGILKHIR